MFFFHNWKYFISCETDSKTKLVVVNSMKIVEMWKNIDRRIKFGRLLSVENMLYLHERQQN